ncbi:hypothetical protein TVAG_312940 [Trichomonas vaginalis G3]|uniref:Uncharacterized protein n=1 Tax=Trichomonas vaginalis (strain ATCC PRA-98 / G3) TaxID=412133 RepID=A2FUK0_TRIV3|nr:protein ubiquitination [Trichomonas vaginalis G3]EAX91407.1 hypothetical protein TVAG_312940 [Trichomonas vaginalis G3]KAI5540965.1 protein ubiquitination [Trichomonas vaginalis G3]|eukprot:XP_001304337.1 hypothetical protein [Trichomonas vaginalis G3]
MSHGISVDTDYIANNIHTYIDDGIFFDIFEEDIISETLAKTSINSQNFITLLTQGKLKYNSYKLFNCVRKCNVCIGSFDEAIQILESYQRCFKLESAHGLIEYLNKFRSEHVSYSNEVTKLQTKIEKLETNLQKIEDENHQYKNEISSKNKENIQLNRSINKFTEITKLLNTDDFESVYKFLKGLSTQGDTISMSISCAVGLSEKKDSNKSTSLLYACRKGDLQLPRFSLLLPLPM